MHNEFHINKKNNHQKFNAEEMVSKKACLMIEEKNLKEGVLEQTILDLMNDEKKIETLENSAKQTSYDNSNAEIIKHINGVINA